MKSAAFHTLGCKVNAYETEAMQRALQQAGYTLRSFEEAADVYVVNTCSVTNIADRKSRQMLHRARSLNPAAVVVAAGCYAQAGAEALKRDGTVDIILGNREKKELAAVLGRYFAARRERQPEEKFVLAEVGDIAAVREYDEPGAEAMEDHTRALLKIQDGCDQFCSYCIIPYLRGRIRSRQWEDIRGEALRLAARGYREMVLTGIHLSSYGKDFSADTVRADAGKDIPEETARNLGEVLRLLDALPGIDRIRVGSLEPKIVAEEFVHTLSELKHFCPHFHLSLQSGSDTVLRRMNRRYSAEEFLRGAELLRSVFPDAAITTDVIVGFPGETEAEFEETVEFVKRVGFYETHVFPYSRRAGTRAANMPGQLTRAEKAARAARLTETAQKLSAEFRERRIGRETEILTEEVTEIDGKLWMVGNSREYVKLGIDARECAALKIGVNQLVRGRAAGFIDGELLRLEQPFLQH